jgi:hypothetical protein
MHSGRPIKGERRQSISAHRHFDAIKKLKSESPRLKRGLVGMKIGRQLRAAREELGRVYYDVLLPRVIAELAINRRALSTMAAMSAMQSAWDFLHNLPRGWSSWREITAFVCAAKQPWKGGGRVTPEELYQLFASARFHCEMTREEIGDLYFEGTGFRKADHSPKKDHRKRRRGTRE